MLLIAVAFSLFSALILTLVNHKSVWVIIWAIWFVWDIFGQVTQSRAKPCNTVLSQVSMNVLGLVSGALLCPIIFMIAILLFIKIK